MLFTGESNYVFASVAFQIQKNRNFIKIKAIFYKEIAQFTILVAIIGNKISKCFSLLAFCKYSIFLHDKHTGAVNLTRAIQCGMICFLFPTHRTDGTAQTRAYHGSFCNGLISTLIIVSLFSTLSWPSWKRI